MSDNKQIGAVDLTSDEEVRRILLDKALFRNDLIAKSLVEALRKIIESFYGDQIETDFKEVLLAAFISAHQVRSFSIGNGYCIPHLRLVGKEKKLSRVGWFRFGSDFALGPNEAINFVFCAIVPEEQAISVLSSAIQIMLDNEFKYCVENYTQEFYYSATVARILFQKTESVNQKMPISLLPGSIETRIVCSRGLHARLSATINLVLEGLECDFEIALDDMQANARDVMGVMMLGAEFGRTVTLKSVGKDSTIAMARVRAILSNASM